MKKVRIGTRESRLAVAQSELVAAYLNEKGISSELIKMKTTGDMILDRSLAQIGGKGLFVKELDKALMDKKSDLSVHSLKDVPVLLPEELPLIGYSKREDPRDVLVLPKGETKPDPKKPVGCSSKRRILQAKKLFPGVKFADIRGNVNTRLSKLDSGEYGALILAAAGLKRLGLEDRISRYFSVDEMIPSAGQGILALQGRKEEDYSYLSGFLNKEAEIQAAAERAFVRQIGGDCTLPVGAHAVIDGAALTLWAMYASKENEEYYVTGSRTGDVRDAERIGCELAKSLIMEYRKDQQERR